MQYSGAIEPDTASDLALFLQSLAEQGQARVSSEPLGPEVGEALAVLRQLDQLSRDELALDAPEYLPDTALWSARLFYHLCQFTVCRDIGEEQIKSACSVPCPGPHEPKSVWSADLTLRHLPRLFQLARHLSNADPLVEQMKLIAVSWPLSSVGIAGLENLQLDSFIGHPALRRLYSDRILATTDASRLGNPTVDGLLRTDLGIHRELAPVLAAKLFSTTHDTH